MARARALASSVLPTPAGPYVALVLIGLAVGILGHLTTARWLVVAGIILVSLGAFLFPLALNVTEEAPRQIETTR